MTNQSNSTQDTVVERLFRAVDFLDERERLVRVQTWVPYWDGRYLCWPSYIADKPGMRACISPCWDRVRIRLLFRKFVAALKAKAQQQ